MINVNLLPKDLIPKKRNFIPYILVAGLAAVLFVWYAGSLATASLKLSRSQAELASLEGSIAELQDVVNQVKQLEQEKLLVSKKEQAVEQIMSGRTVWSHELYVLSGLVPEGVWLEKISISSRKRPVTVEVPNPNRGTGQPPTIRKTVIQSFPALRITGFALSPQREKGLSHIGSFIRNIKNSEVFSQRFVAPEMRSIKREGFREQTVMKFVMDCEITG